MNLEDSVRLTAKLTGDLRPTGGSSESQLRRIRELVADCLLLDQAEPLFTAGDPLALAKLTEIEPSELAKIRVICTRAAAAIQSHPSTRLEFRAFRRAVPTIADVGEAAPPWAAGAAVPRSFGPFMNPDGRPFWFSIYQTPRLVPVVREGGGPAVLFLSLAEPLQAGGNYVLPASSVWIAANALAVGAPAGAYCGLRISGGSLLLSEAATTTSGRMIVPVGTVLHLDLKLDSPDQPNIPGASRLHPGSIEAQYPAEARILLSPGGADVSMTRARLRVFATNIAFERNTARPPVYQDGVNRVLIPCTAALDQLDVAAVSTLSNTNGSAPVAGLAWALPVAHVAQPIAEAAGAGGLAVDLGRGVDVQWLGLRAKVSLASAQLVVEPQGTSLTASAFVRVRTEQRFTLWADRALPQRRCSVDLRYGPKFLLRFRIEADGSETLAGAASCAAHLDRPVSASGVRLPIRAPDASTVFFFGGGAGRSLLVRCTLAPRNPAFALSNALLLTGPPSSFSLFGSISAAAGSLDSGATALQVSVFSIVPFLPDPYADNLRHAVEPALPIPRASFRSHIRWTGPDAAPAISFRLDPAQGTRPSLEDLLPASLTPHDPPPRPVQGDAEALQLDAVRRKALHDLFTGTLASAPEKILLLDVSTNADQFGVGFGPRLGTIGAPERQPSRTIIEGLSLVTLGRDLRVFTVPQIQWEPVWTIQNPDLAVFPSPLASADDGGPTLLGTNSVKLVPIAPEPLVRSLVSEFKSGDQQFFAAALFTLPFGMAAAAAPLALPPEPQMRGAAFNLIEPRSKKLNLAGGLQVSLTALDPLSTPGAESPSLRGYTVQTRNGIDANTGARLALSVLSDKNLNVVESTFNSEFGPGGGAPRVPVTRIDFSGYGASLFSHWRNPEAQIAQTSEVRFDVAVGRTAHEVVQIRTILYPWAVRVVRTITIQRTGGGGVFRRDSGWVAASDGVFQFPSHSSGSRIETHPGLARGVFNVRRIRDTAHAFDRELPGPTGPVRVRLAAVRFDCEVQLSDVAAGASGGLVTSVDQIGFVQLNPQGDPLTPQQYSELLAAEGPLGGPVDCLIDVARSGQLMRITRVAVATAPQPATDFEFAAAALGSLLLPKDGQWSLCRQPTDVTRECEPLDPHIGVPLVREGRATVSEATNNAPYRFADPADLLTGTSGRNIAILWSTGTQRLLFSRPRIAKGSKSITSDVSALLADPFSTTNSGALFPPALTCLRVPFANYSLEILGESLLRLVLPSATFAAQPFSGNLRRELSKGDSTRILTDYTNTRIRVALDSSAPQTFAYEQTGVAIVQEEDGVHAKTSHGVFRGSSAQATRWTLEGEEFGELFAQPKNFMPMFNSLNLAGSLPSGGATAPLDTTEKPDGPNPKIGLKITIPVEKNIPMYIGVTTGGKIEIASDFQNFFSIEAVVGILVAAVFPGGAYFKYEAQALKRPLRPGSDTKIKAGSKEQLILAIGIYKNDEVIITPYPLQFNWVIFAGIGFSHEAKAGVTSVGVGIIFVASGSVQYPPGDLSIAEVGVKVEGQGLIEFRGGDQFLILKGTIAIEITVAVVLDIEWEIVEGTVCEAKI